MILLPELQPLVEAWTEESHRTSFVVAYSFSGFVATCFCVPVRPLFAVRFNQY